MKMNDFSKTRVLVVGDVMLDQYWSGRAGRISPEAPVPVVKVADEDVRAGGAANVALNIAALGAQVRLLGVVGHDPFGTQLSEVLDAAQVPYDWVISEAGTICKLRVLSHHQQLIRMDFENAVPVADSEALAKKFADAVADFDVVVVSDYAKGALQSVAAMIAAAKRHSVPVLVDPKGDDFSRYRGATLVKPNQGEFEQIVGACATEEALVAQAQSLIERLGFEALLVTRSEHGMALVEKNRPPTLMTSRAQEVFDVTGAGDTVIAALATAFGSGMRWQEAMRIANEAAGIVVRKVGTSIVTRVELEAQLNAAMRHKAYVSMSEDEVTSLIRLAQQQGHKVVFTNGCFDLLHVGHVSYLQKARELGDLLVVGLNTDRSVQRLKGPSRPLVEENDRAQLLAALSCVSYVVLFDEDTPLQLIETLKPDVLVKGADYTPETVVGGKEVESWGGSVELIEFVDGRSTTGLVERIRESD